MAKITEVDQGNSHFLSLTGSAGTEGVSTFLALSVGEGCVPPSWEKLGGLNSPIPRGKTHLLLPQE